MNPSLLQVRNKKEKLLKEKYLAIVFYNKTLKTVISSLKGFMYGYHVTKLQRSTCWAYVIQSRSRDSYCCGKFNWWRSPKKVDAKKVSKKDKRQINFDDKILFGLHLLKDLIDFLWGPYDICLIYTYLHRTMYRQLQI